MCTCLCGHSCSSARACMRTCARLSVCASTVPRVRMCLPFDHTSFSPRNICLLDFIVQFSKGKLAKAKSAVVAIFSEIFNPADHAFLTQYKSASRVLTWNANARSAVRRKFRSSESLRPFGRSTLWSLTLNVDVQSTVYSGPTSFRSRGSSSKSALCPSKSREKIS